MSFMDSVQDSATGWETLCFLYSSALKKTNTIVEILSDEFVHIHHYNPIEHVKSRIKSPESIAKKLQKHNRETTLQNMVEYVKDIAGIRIICSFTPDIYLIAEMLANQQDLTVLSIKDYIQYPKDSGYMSYHMLVSIPVHLAGGTEHITVEIQIRTVAMDFWASLEHKIYYKFEGHAPAYIQQSLTDCAAIVANLDNEMWSLSEALRNASESDETDDIVYEKEI